MGLEPGSIFAALTAGSLGLMLWQHGLARRYPLHRRARVPASLPAVTVLKPLAGVDAGTRECLASWLAQDYPGPVQVLFAAAAADPAGALAAELCRAHPGADARLVACPRRAAANPKVSKLRQLEAEAEHGVLVISDADVRVPRDFLAQAVTLLGAEGVGLVNCFYRQPAPSGVPMQLEAVGVNADMWTQVLQARALGPVRFALGAVMVLRRETLAGAGGFAALGDYLADDNQLGRRVAAQGLRVAFMDVVADCLEAPAGWRQVWRHQRRWNTTLRVCAPAPFFFSILGNATLWAALWLLAAPGGAAAAALAAVLGLRTATAAAHWRRLLGRPLPARRWWIVPARDLWQAVQWALAFLTLRVTWRGETYRVRAGGRLERLARPPVMAAPALPEDSPAAGGRLG
jgi:ceramide glucosyltransferase